MAWRTRPRRAGAIAVSAALALGALVPGVSAGAGAAGPPDVVGRWSQPFEEGGADLPRCQPADGAAGSAVCKPTAVETAVLPDGRVFYLNGIETGPDRRDPSAPPLSPPAAGGQARVLDLRTGPPRWSAPASQPGDVVCSDVTALPNGKLLLAGGRPDTRLFDPRTDTFEPAAPMRHGRSDAHAVIGPDGDPTVFGGVTPLGSDGGGGSVRRTETYRVASNTWEENDAGPASETSLPPQPRIVLAPNGQFFYAAAGERSGPAGPAADDALTGFFQFFDPKTKRWSVSGLAPLGARSGAFVVPLTLEPPYDHMTLVAGGGVVGPTPGSGLPANPLTTLTTIDANGNVTNRNAGNLNHARWYSSGVLLPDGQVLAVGGAGQEDASAPGLGTPVQIPELYNPQTTQWTEVAPHTRARGYHHSALLLPDMRVLLGGTDDDPSFEIWSPPYLFRGSRPSVTHVQKGVGYGETFDVTTPDAATVESVLLLRTPSPGHVNDSGQRSLKLEFTRRGPHTLTATAPPSGNVAPPGAYYLVVNRRSLQGPVPSVARLVDVGRTDPSEAPQPYSADTPVPR